MKLIIPLLLLVTISGCQSFRLKIESSDSDRQNQDSEISPDQDDTSSYDDDDSLDIDDEEEIVTEEPQKDPEIPPAAKSLLKKADDERSLQNYDRSEHYVERALRISPESPYIHFYYSQILLEQEKNSLAESRAFKALSLCEHDKNLKKRLWQLIAISRHREGDNQGSINARRKAEQYSH